MLFYIVENGFTVSSGEIHFIHEDEYRYAVLPQELPERGSVALHAVCCTYDKDGIVKHTHRPLCLCCKIGMAGSIEKINVCIS